MNEENLRKLEALELESFIIDESHNFVTAPHATDPNKTGILKLEALSTLLKSEAYIDQPVLFLSGTPFLNQGKWDVLSTLSHAEPLFTVLLDPKSKKHPNHRADYKKFWETSEKDACIGNMMVRMTATPDVGFPYRHDFVVWVHIPPKSYTARLCRMVVEQF